MDDTKFSLQKAFDKAPVRCREQHFTPTIERAAGPNSAHALVGSVSSNSGSMQIFWNADGTAVRVTKTIFSDYPDSDFDLLMAV
ncbi:hypothetical protein [Herbaspirillum sp. RV1423]|uniref:hypothetical protein n=1 Tax=Herbaspirillum sp. RV1423 TaxID=1443993 RepID=UPI000557FE1D|nr:hypothetical protein [Herbaspirillum sp. RV1423]